jgi:hypothetical protein
VGANGEGGTHGAKKINFKFVTQTESISDRHNPPNISSTKIFGSIIGAPAQLRLPSFAKGHEMIVAQKSSKLFVNVCGADNATTTSIV